jgi:hypothetical protein
MEVANEGITGGKETRRQNRDLDKAVAYKRSQIDSKS